MHDCLYLRLQDTEKSKKQFIRKRHFCSLQIASLSSEIGYIDSFSEPHLFFLLIASLTRSFDWLFVCLLVCLRV